MWMQPGGPGAPLDANAAPIEVVQLKPRDAATGAVWAPAEADAQVAAAARAALDAAPHAVVVVHSVASSKTGLLTPSLACLRALRDGPGGERVVGVVDACQVRGPPRAFGVPRRPRAGAGVRAPVPRRRPAHLGVVYGRMPIWDRWGFGTSERGGQRTSRCRGRPCSGIWKPLSVYLKSPF